MNKLFFFKKIIFDIFILVAFCLDVFTNLYIFFDAIIEYKAYIFPEAFVLFCGKAFPFIGICFVLFVYLVYVNVFTYIFFLKLNKYKKTRIVLSLIMLSKSFLYALLQRGMI